MTYPMSDVLEICDVLGLDPNSTQRIEVLPRTIEITRVDSESNSIVTELHMVRRGPIIEDANVDHTNPWDQPTLSQED